MQGEIHVGVFRVHVLLAFNRLNLETAKHGKAGKNEVKLDTCEKKTRTLQQKTVVT